MTGNDVINEALLLVRRITPGQTASTDEIATCKLALNNLLGEWNAQGLAIYSVAPKTFAMVAGTADYTIGTGATWNTPRPVRIEAWNHKTSSGQATGGAPVDAPTFAAMAIDRTAQGARIRALNYDAAYPLGSIHLYPRPSGGTLEIWVWDILAVITDFTATLDYPPGYIQGIVFNLALTIAGKFEKPLDPNVKDSANAAKAALVSSNANQHHSMPPAQAA
jgi:hypothetical protein